MLSLRQVGTVVWTFLAFMVAASLVLNLRYKRIGEGEARYLDTWTGRIHAVETSVNAPPAKAGLQASEGSIEIAILEGLYRRGVQASTCRAARFAFPAEGSDVR
jgi:hypothetical protein